MRCKSPRRAAYRTPMSMRLYQCRGFAELQPPGMGNRGDRRSIVCALVGASAVQRRRPLRKIPRPLRTQPTSVEFQCSNSPLRTAGRRSHDGSASRGSPTSPTGPEVQGRRRPAHWRLLDSNQRTCAERWRTWASCRAALGADDVWSPTVSVCIANDAVRDTLTLARPPARRSGPRTRTARVTSADLPAASTGND